MASYIHVDQAAKARALKLIRAGEILPVEAAKLVGVSLSAVGIWTKGFNRQAARWRRVQEAWKEAKAAE
jgi:hypothetical protein